MLPTCNDAKTRTASILITLFSLLVFAIEASAKPLLTYFRYELLKSGALKNLTVGDFNGDKLTDIAGLMPSQRKLVVVPAKGKLKFRSQRLFRLPSRAQSLFAVHIEGEKRASLALLASSPSRAQLWKFRGSVGNFWPEKIAEISLPDAEQLYLSKQRSPNQIHFFARTEMGHLMDFSFQAKEGFSKSVPLLLSHHVSDVVLSARPTSDFFTKAVGENVLWLHRSPPASALAIRCKESVSLAATCDFNSNDLLDLVIIQAVSNGKTAVEVMFDVGVETGVAPIQFETPLNPTQAFIEDFNADGLLDIGLCDEGSFEIHFAQSKTVFFRGMLIAFSDVASSVSVADLNQDRKPELIVSEQKTGKLVVYSTTHYELGGVERLATSGEPEQISVHSARKELLVGCNRYHQLEQVRIARQSAHIGSYLVTGRVVSLWQNDREIIWLTTSPVTLARKSYKSEEIVPQRLFSLGASQSLLWHGTEGQSAILAVLEERSIGAVPQLLFYALHSDSTRRVSELLLDAPISAESITRIAGATLKNRHFLVALKSEKDTQVIVVYEIKLEKTCLRLVQVSRYALPKSFSRQPAQHLLVRVNRDEAMDFLVANSERALLLLSEKLYQPQQISNFPKLNATDVVVWSDGDGDNRADLFISCHRHADVLFLRGRSNGTFHAPKVILGDVIATGMASVVTKQHATLFVANSKLHTVDILRLKK